MFYFFWRAVVLCGGIVATLSSTAVFYRCLSGTTVNNAALKNKKYKGVTQQC
jgi:hypothetical protein